MQAQRSLPVDLEQPFLSELGARLAKAHGADKVFPPSRSISVARALLDDGTAADWEAKTLASRAGVTVVTLQRGFRDCLGMTVAAYGQGVKLDLARARLMCGWESRSMAQIAQQSNFRTVVAFTRAYQRRFGETPTQTRVYAVRCNNEGHDDG